ncbi:hypothetical protein B0H19DRAFT_1270865 [Mycena capillaripes]|nr:hypothetical protein B0H19DRAFT_1270865 [Mycena capillaripes]
MFVRHSGWTHRGFLKTELREELQTEVVHYIDLVEAIILKEADSSTRCGPSEVRPPVIALVRAHNSAFCMRFPHLTYRDLLEYMAGLQRSVAELQAYVLWHDRIQYGNIPASTRSFELGLRGSIAQNPTDYNALRKLGVPVWLELSQANMSLFDVTKRVELTAMRVETRKWDDMSVSQFLRDTRKGKLVHNKPLEYYPPAVDANTAYESAARGYSPRQDLICRDLHSLQDVLKMVETGDLSGNNHNKSAALGVQVRAAGNTAGELMEKYAADRAIAPTAEAVLPRETNRKSRSGGQSKWFRQFSDLSKCYEKTRWAPAFVEAWNMARQDSDYYPLLHNIKLEPKCKTLLLYLAPPPHLFLGVQSIPKMCNFFFIWMCIRRPWLSRIRNTFDDPISWGLTTQKWRNILSGEYWKYRHPTDGGVEFQLRKFWKKGGPLIFSEEEIGDVEDDISPQMLGSSTGRLEPEIFMDDGTKALVLWDLTLCHSQLQLDRADEILYTGSLLDARERSMRRIRRADLFHSPDWNWSITRNTPPWEQPLADRTRRHWLSRLLEVVRFWPCASKKIDWFLAEQKFWVTRGTSQKRAEALFCDSLTDGKLHTLEMSLVAVYYQGVFDALGILAVGVIERPVTTPDMDPFYMM